MTLSWPLAVVICVFFASNALVFAVAIPRLVEAYRDKAKGPVS